jgi:hypothetical protein
MSQNAFMIPSLITVHMEVSFEMLFGYARVSTDGIVKLLGASRELGELDGAKAGLGYAACVMPQTSCHAWKARVRSAR